MPFGKDDVKKSCQVIGTEIREARKSCDGKHAVRELIRRYLRVTPEGKALLEEMRGLDKRQVAMLVLSPDGWLELYGSRDYLDVEFFTRHPYDSTAKARRISEELLEEQMGKRFRKIFMPNAMPGYPGLLKSTMVEATELPSGRNVFRFSECKNRWQNTIDGAVYVRT